jgi:hypothetical protein
VPDAAPVRVIFVLDAFTVYTPYNIIYTYTYTCVNMCN